MHIPRRVPIALLLWGATLTVLPAFEEDWVSFGQNANLRKSGQTTTLEYKAVPGQLGMAIMPAGEGKLAQMTHLRFRLRTDVATVVGVILSEKKPGGGDYTSTFWSPKDQWQQIDLTSADFLLNDGPNDAKDADGRLDVDQVQAVGVMDLGQFFSQLAANPNLHMAVSKLTGAHTLEIEDFRIVSGDKAGPGRTPAVVDDFRREFLTWFSPGGAELALSKSGNPLSKPALEFNYLQDPASITVVVHSLAGVDLRGAERLSFDIASTKDAQVILALELTKTDPRGGPRYNHNFEVSAGKPGHMSIPFEEFVLAEDSPPDPAGHLDLGKVRTLSLVDVSALLNGNVDKNTIWVADITAQ